MASDIEIRDEILVQLYGVRPGSRPADRLAKTARAGGLTVADAEVIREAEYLVMAGLIAAVKDPADPTVKRYTLTQAGWDAAKLKGLI